MFRSFGGEQAKLLSAGPAPEAEILEVYRWQEWEDTAVRTLDSIKT